jgi:beta-lactam-binding protein with PASTA domain
MGSSPKVTLLLATEAGSQTLLMPNLIGKKLSEVDALTERSGLRLGKVRGVARPASNTVAGTVLKQWPLAGSRVSSGSAVSLEVAR